MNALETNGAGGKAADGSILPAPGDSGSDGMTQLYVLLAAMPNPVAHVSAERQYLFVNEPYAALYDTEPQKLIGHHLPTLVGAENYRKVESRISRASAGETMRFETSWTYPALGARLIEATYVPDAETGDAARGFFIFVTDLTERLRSEAELVHAHKMDAMGQLTGGIAHDFNNLLTIIGGNLQLLRNGLDLEADPGLLEIVDDALSASRQGAGLTSQLLAFARKQDLDPAVLDLADVVESVSKLLRRTLGANITVRNEIESDPPVIKADRSQLENALLNMAINGRDAMPGGGVITLGVGEVTIGQENTDHASLLPPGVYAAISVSDTGGGMADDVAEHAFEPFFTTKAHGQGTGLGLSMVYGFAKQSGGDVMLRTSAGAGTTVTILLPSYAEGAAASPPEPRGTPRPQRAAAGAILVVEDEDRVRRFACRILRQAGYEVFEAANADQALRVLESEQGIDLLFSDIMMPGSMSGSELAHVARARRPELKVLLTTGYDARAGTENDFAAPVLRKPYSVNALSDNIARLLQEV
jgi:signal transduction histidine kinase